MGRLRRGGLGTRDRNGLLGRGLSGVTGRCGRAALVHVSLWLLLVGSCLVRVLRAMLRHHSWLVLRGVVDGRRGHVGDARVSTLVCNIGSHAAGIVARTWARANRALRGEAALRLVVRVTGEDGAIGDGRRRGGCVTADLGELSVGLTMILRWHHLMLEALVASGWATVAVLIVVIILAAVEVGRALVLIGSAMLHRVSIDDSAWRRDQKLTN